MRYVLAVLVSLYATLASLGADAFVEAVRAADTARVMATIAGKTERLAPLLSDELTYAHADGRVQTKAQFLGAVKSGQIKYEAYDYDDVKVSRVADDVATMTGKAHVRASAGNVRVEFSLKFLAVWRLESGTWRLFAYQSARLPEAAKEK